MPSKLQSISKGAKMRRSQRRQSGTVISLLLLLLLALSLSACASICPVPEPISPSIPAAPEIATPAPVEPYSTFWSRELSDLRNKVRALRASLTPTTPMSSPSR